MWILSLIDSALLGTNDLATGSGLAVGRRVIQSARGASAAAQALKNAGDSSFTGQVVRNAVGRAFGKSQSTPEGFVPEN